ncbi:MAG: Crp/Fnr family transcriptional regulator [Gammaproteobacteria bacterium]|nr:Crp/Fnr family transcriptional regulator [Gammaproteobacteria bacterium]
MNIVENKKSKTITDIYEALPSDSRKSLMDFAEYLFQRDAVDEPALQQKLDISRPETESVVAALKRLNKTYPMIERKLIFHEASSLMTDHIMQGRDVVEVIDELERLFDQHYQDVLLMTKDSES